MRLSNRFFGPFRITRSAGDPENLPLPVSNVDKGLPCQVPLQIVHDPRDACRPPVLHLRVR
jgi:hypothetical protein